MKKIICILFALVAMSTSAQSLLDISKMPKSAVRQPDAYFQHAVYINIDRPSSGEGEMDAVCSVWLAPGDVSKVIVEGCPDGRNVWTYIIDPHQATARQLPSTEGIMKLDWEHKEIIASSYGYDDEGRYSVQKAYSLDGTFLRQVGDKERE